MRQIAKGATDQTIYFEILDIASTTGGRKTGIAYNAAGLTAYYVRAGGSATSITLASQTAGGAHADGGWAEVDATNMPGVYRLDLPDAAVAAGAESVVVTVKGAADMVQASSLIQLMPANWGVLSIDGNGRLDVIKIAGTTQTARDIGASVLLSSGTGTGQISLSSGLVTLAAVTHTGAVIPTVSTLTGHTPQTGDTYARMTRAIVTGSITGGSTTTSLNTTGLSPAAAVTDQFKGRIIVFDAATTTANLRGQASDITASTSGGVLTVTALTTAPAAGDTFTIL